MVETAIALPFLIFVLAASWTAWTGLNTSIGLVGAARAGAITAADYLHSGNSAASGGGYTPSEYNTPENAMPPGAPTCVAGALPPPETCAETPLQIAEDRAASAIDSEEGSPAGTFKASHRSCASGTACVTISAPLGATSGQQMVSIAVRQSVAAKVTVVSGLSVHVSASAKVPA